MDFYSGPQVVALRLVGSPGIVTEVVRRSPSDGAHLRTLGLHVCPRGGGAPVARPVGGETGGEDGAAIFVERLEGTDRRAVGSPEELGRASRRVRVAEPQRPYLGFHLPLSSSNHSTAASGSPQRRGSGRSSGGGASEVWRANSSPMKPPGVQPASANRPRGASPARARQARGRDGRRTSRRTWTARRRTRRRGRGIPFLSRRDTAHAVRNFPRDQDSGVQDGPIGAALSLHRRVVVM